MGKKFKRAEAGISARKKLYVVLKGGTYSMNDFILSFAMLQVYRKKGGDL